MGDCLLKTQDYANLKKQIYDLTSALCQYDKTKNILFFC